MLPNEILMIISSFLDGVSKLNFKLMNKNICSFTHLNKKIKTLRVNFEKKQTINFVYQNSFVTKYLYKVVFWENYNIEYSKILSKDTRAFMIKNSLFVEFSYILELVKLFRPNFEERLKKEFILNHNYILIQMRTRKKNELPRIINPETKEIVIGYDVIDLLMMYGINNTELLSGDVHNNIKYIEFLKRNFPF